MTDRKFHRTTITIEVLSEEAIPDGMDLEKIASECTDGAWTMRTLKYKEVELNGHQAAANLLRQGSDPSFFQLTSKGEDAE